jgi:hypothetical protein
MSHSPRRALTDCVCRDLDRLDAPVFTGTASAGNIINAIDGCGEQDIRPWTKTPTAHACAPGPLSLVLTVLGGLDVGVGAAEIVTGSRDGR